MATTKTHAMQIALALEDWGVTDISDWMHHTDVYDVQAELTLIAGDGVTQDTIEQDAALIWEWIDNGGLLERPVTTEGR